MVQVMRKGWADDIEAGIVHSLGLGVCATAEEGVVLFVAVVEWRSVEPLVCGFRLTVVPDRLLSGLFGLG